MFNTVNTLVEDLETQKKTIHAALQKVVEYVTEQVSTVKNSPD